MGNTWQFIINYWPYLASMLGSILAILSFIKNIFIIRKLQLEIQKLNAEKISKDDERFKIIQKLTDEEIVKYRKRFSTNYDYMRRSNNWTPVEPKRRKFTRPLKISFFYLLFHYLFGVYEFDSFIFDSLSLISHLIFSYCLLTLILGALFISEKLYMLYMKCH